MAEADEMDEWMEWKNTGCTTMHRRLYNCAVWFHDMAHHLDVYRELDVVDTETEDPVSIRTYTLYSARYLVSTTPYHSTRRSLVFDSRYSTSMHGRTLASPAPFGPRRLIEHRLH